MSSGAVREWLADASGRSDLLTRSIAHLTVQRSGIISSRMRCRTLLLIIAPVVLFPELPAAAQSSPQRAPSPGTAAKIEALIERNAKNAEVVSFAGRRQYPVRVVRGKLPSSDASIADGSSDNITLTPRQHTSARILAGEPVAATLAVATAAPLRQPIGASVQVVTFSDRVGEGVTVLRGSVPMAPVDPALATGADLDLFHAARGADLERVAFAVDGAESSHGADPGMWRADLDGPQGPMQVSAAAASDSGGGDRFDLMQNRRLGRAYLARLFLRYGNWPDTVAAYNWGPGNMDIWIAQGRPAAGFPLEVERYRERVLRDGGIWRGPGSPLLRSGSPLSVP